MSDGTPNWGIQPVPERLRVLGFADNLLLWTNLGISLLVLVAASYFGLSLKAAVAATILGGLLGSAMLATAALIGADARVPTMVLQRAPLGQRGSWIATGLNTLQCLGWSVFEITVIATAAGALTNRVFGFHGVWIWKLVFGGVGLALALMGPIGFVRRFVRKFAIWAVGASIVWLAYWILAHADVHRLWHAGGSGGSFWAAVDLVIALTVSWIPLVADYTRFSRTRRDAFWGAGLGYLLPTLFQFGFGSILVLSHPAIDGPTAVLVTVAAGGVGAVIALLALTVDETDEAFANIYSTAVSIQNFEPRLSQRRLIVGVATTATLASLAVGLGTYQDFLLLLGACFVPLFGVLLADWLVAGRHYSEDDIFTGPDWRPGMIAAWAAGFTLYQYLAPAGPGWWKSLIHHSAPPFNMPASLPSFALAFALAGAASLVTRRAGVLATSPR